MKTRFEPRFLRMSSWKKTSHAGVELWTPAYGASILSLDHHCRYQRFPHTNISPIQNYQGLILAGHFYWFGRFVPSKGIFTSIALCGDIISPALVVQCQNTRNCCRGPGFKSWDWILIFFSCWNSRETRFKSGFHSSFWDFICGILEVRYG